MKAILSADRTWGLGYQGRLLVSIPSDLRFFRETTMGHVVVMGRKTLATLPAGQPLKGRTNIILSRDPEWTVRGATVVHSIKELMEVLKPYEDDDIYVAGGGEIYRQLLPYCDTAYVTRIDMTYQADTFFEDLDESPDWEMVEEGDEQTCFDIEFYFTEYRRKNEKHLHHRTFPYFLRILFHSLANHLIGKDSCCNRRIQRINISLHRNSCHKVTKSISAVRLQKAPAFFS